MDEKVPENVLETLSEGGQVGRTRFLLQDVFEAGRMESMWASGELQQPLRQPVCVSSTYISQSVMVPARAG